MFLGFWSRSIYLFSVVHVLHVAISHRSQSQCYGPHFPLQLLLLLLRIVAALPSCSQRFDQTRNGNSPARPIEHYHNDSHWIHVWPNVT
jgi:hypothetical protein